MSRTAAKRIKAAAWVLFGIYVALMVYLLFFGDRYGHGPGEDIMRYNLVPLREIRRFLSYRDQLGTRAVVMNLAGNVLLFVPFGAILPVLSRSLRSPLRIAGAGLLLSVSVEVLQLLTRLGSFDVDDLILNTLGALLGYGIFAVCDRFRRKYIG